MKSWGQGGGGLSDQVTTLSSHIALLVHVLLASASTHFLDPLTLLQVEYKGGGTSPIPNLALLTSSCGAGRREIRRFVGGRV